MAKPCVSVLLPVRNGADYLPECIESLRSQTFENFEVIAVDDGSKDESADLLLQWASEDDRVVVVRQPPMGIVMALEAGRKRISGKYLARMDADDIAEPTRLDEQRCLLDENLDLMGCGSGIRYFPRNGMRDGSIRYESWLNDIRNPEDVERNLFVECPLAHPTFFLRSSIVSEVGGYMDHGWPEDYDLLLRIWKSGARLGIVGRVLMHWRDWEGRVSRHSEVYSADAFRRCKVHYLLRTLAKDRNGLVIWGAGPLGKAFGREVKNQGGSLRAFVDLDDRKIGQNIHGVTVIHPLGINEHKDGYCVAAVGQIGAREKIRNELQRAGWHEVMDFIAVA